MQIEEIIRLSEWYNSSIREVSKKYSELVSVLQHNAQQPNQQPVAEPLKTLSTALTEMPTEQLSAQQFQVLESLGVSALVGKRGREWLNRRVRSTTYDPATTFAKIQEASQKIANAQNQLNDLRKAAVQVGFSHSLALPEDTPFVINITFRDDASIENVRDWKTSASDWELIISGVSGVVKQKAEEVRVLGVANGSIIMSLAAGPLVTKIFATISKHIASMANDYLDFQLKREDLERSRMMSEVMRKELDRQEKERRAEGKSTILEAVKEIARDADPESLVKLEKAIDRQISFREKGGDIDFVTPQEAQISEGEEIVEAIFEVREMVEQYRLEAQRTKLLTKSDYEDEFSDES